MRVECNVGNKIIMTKSSQTVFFLRMPQLDRIIQRSRKKEITLFIKIINFVCLVTILTFVQSIEITSDLCPSKILEGFGEKKHLSDSSVPSLHKNLPANSYPSSLSPLFPPNTTHSIILPSCKNILKNLLFLPSQSNRLL